MAGPVKVLGVDPGSRSTGWGVVTREGGRYRLLAAGAIRTAPADPMPARLLAIHRELGDIVRLWAPDVCAIEAIFAHKSATSALVLGQARGVALVAVAAAGVPVYEYNASTIKSAVAGSGRADKEAVGKMVAILLGGQIEGPHDAADAVAIAMTHHAHAHRHAAEARVAERTAALVAARAPARGPRLPTSLAELAAVKASRAKSPAPRGPARRAGGGVAGGAPPPHEEEPE
jgi:crossover junction endodeoxyribonuclease RuvC